MEINSDPEEMSTSNPGQLRFRVPIIKGSLAPTPQQGVFLKWRMVMDPTEIDEDEEEGTTSTEIIPDILIDGAAEAEEDHGDNDTRNIAQYYKLEYLEKVTFSFQEHSDYIENFSSGERHRIF